MECKCEECEHRFLTLEKAITSSDKEIEKLKDNKEKTNIDVALLCEQIKNLCSKVDKLTQRIDNLTSKDGQSWDKAKWIIITAIITAIMSFLLAKVGL